MNSNDYMIVNYIIPIAGLLITFLAQLYVNNSYNKYKEKNLTNKITGKEVARKILDQNGLENVRILEARGKLTDHYDPRKKVVSLSSEIYHGTTIASSAVAAHECGHAIQDKESYLFLKIRSLIVPIVNFSTKIGYLVVMIGIIIGMSKLALIGLILLIGMLFFQLITLPVEFNASKRAKKQLQKLKIVDKNEEKYINTMLRAAALTYVASLITTLLQILRLALIAFGRRDD